VYFSSSAAYPVRHQTLRSGHGPLVESDIDLEDADQPDAVYGWVKLTGERLAQYVNALGAGVYVFRPFSGYGTDQDTDYPFPSFARRAWALQDPFVVWGTGEQVRDWVHIDDVVDALVETLDWDPLVVGPLNICTGVGTSFTRLAQMFMAEAGYSGDVEPRADAPVGVMRRVGDPTKLHKIYKPRVTIEEGVARALRDR
jgi:nucleoside-diphosphate-sugar epimerase